MAENAFFFRCLQDAKIRFSLLTYYKMNRLRCYLLAYHQPVQFFYAKHTRKSVCIYFYIFNKKVETILLPRYDEWWIKIVLKFNWFLFVWVTVSGLSLCWPSTFDSCYEFAEFPNEKSLWEKIPQPLKGFHFFAPSEVDINTLFFGLFTSQCEKNELNGKIEKNSTQIHFL